MDWIVLPPHTPRPATSFPVNVSGDSFFQRQLRLNEIRRWGPNPIGLVAERDLPLCHTHQGKAVKGGRLQARKRILTGTWAQASSLRHWAWVRFCPLRAHLWLVSWRRELTDTVSHLWSWLWWSFQGSRWIIHLTNIYVLYSILPQ